MNGVITSVLVHAFHHHSDLSNRQVKKLVKMLTKNQKKKENILLVVSSFVSQRATKKCHGPLLMSESDTVPNETTVFSKQYKSLFCFNFALTDVRENSAWHESSLGLIIKWQWLTLALLVRVVCLIQLLLNLNHKHFKHCKTTTTTTRATLVERFLTQESLLHLHALQPTWGKSKNTGPLILLKSKVCYQREQPRKTFAIVRTLKVILNLTNKSRILFCTVDERQYICARIRFAYLTSF